MIVKENFFFATTAMQTILRCAAGGPVENLFLLVEVFHLFTRVH